MKDLAIVVPCYNEEAVLPETGRRLLELLTRLESRGRVSDGSRIYLVDDGSSDATWEIIRRLASDDPRVHGIKLSRNLGHQKALLAGLLSAEGDAVVSIDADLQDDLAAIEHMIDRSEEGYDIIYGVRDDRDSDSLFKRVTAQAYYRLLAAFGVDVIYNHADFRFMSRRAIEALREYPEANLFLRGLVRLLGFRWTVVYYARGKRFAGESKYPLRKMLALAFDGISSFSAIPLRLIAVLGFIVFLFSVAMTAWVFWTRLFTDNAVPGWASSVIPVYFLGGVQLLSIGILGEYVAKIYLETKRRPRFVIEETTTKGAVGAGGTRGYGHAESPGGIRTGGAGPNEG